MVANEPAYQLVLTPKDHRSLIGRVVIAVDAKYGMPLRVQVFAKGATSARVPGRLHPAVSSPRPAAANLTFTPPPGASVRRGEPGRQGRGKADAGKPATERFRHLRQELAHRGWLPQQTSFRTRNGRGRLWHRSLAAGSGQAGDRRRHPAGPRRAARLGQAGAAAPGAAARC